MHRFVLYGQAYRIAFVAILVGYLNSKRLGRGLLTALLLLKWAVCLLPKMRNTHRPSKTSPLGTGVEARSQIV